MNMNPYASNQFAFQPGGVAPNPQGFAAPAQVGRPSFLSEMTAMAAFSKLGKGFASSDSYSSTSSNVSIVKYDDHFKEKGWCLKNLRKPDNSRFTEEELKKNPPLALKFGDKDCEIVVPIPSHEAMCAATKEMINAYMHRSNTPATTENKKMAAKAISKMLILNYVEDCGYGDDPLQKSCFDNMVESQQEQLDRLLEARGPRDDPVSIRAFFKRAQVGDAIRVGNLTLKKSPNYTRQIQDLV